jgi:hypothetical protein
MPLFIVYGFVDFLVISLHCSGIAEKVFSPAPESWDFRLNEILISALQFDQLLFTGPRATSLFGVSFLRSPIAARRLSHFRQFRTKYAAFALVGAKGWL